MAEKAKKPEGPIESISTAIGRVAPTAICAIQTESSLMGRRITRSLIEQE